MNHVKRQKKVAIMVSVPIEPECHSVMPAHHINRKLCYRYATVFKFFVKISGVAGKSAMLWALEGSGVRLRYTSRVNISYAVRTYKVGENHNHYPR